MTLHTASEVISLAKKLEIESGDFYKSLFQKYNGEKELFLVFSEENKKNITQIERAYYGVISDAIEGGFTFNIEEDLYAFNADQSGNSCLSDDLNGAIGIEETIAKFYSDAAEQSMSLITDVKRIFSLLAKKRRNRITMLTSLAGEM